MKEFYGSISVSGRVHFSVEAKTEEEAKKMIFNDLISMIIEVKADS